MTEKQWLACTDPEKMLDQQENASDRKLRLFGCACCRQVWASLTEGRFLAAVEVAERFADGRASNKELAAAKRASGAALERSGSSGVVGATYCALGTAWSCTRNPPTAATYPLWVFTDEADRKRQVLILRDLFGNPYRPVSIRPTWLACGDGTVVKMAQSIYDDRELPAGTLDPARLAVLADALEEAGCTEKPVLSHLRAAGPHVRGCWVLDLILGKE
jgi:hypothetical protein